MDNLTNIINEAEAILITAGAGMGVDSGLPDFRGNEGFWEAYPAIAHLGLSFQEMANPQWFESDPNLAWAFYGHRLNLYRETIPHDGFKLLLDYVQEKNNNYFVFTSNVDGQFQKAGFDPNKIIECHGSIHHLQCLVNCTDTIWDNNETIKVDMDKFNVNQYPHCKFCNTTARPNILMFGDWGWNHKREELQAQRYTTFLKNNALKKLIIIEIGAGLAVPTVRFEGENIASRYNATLIRINPKDYQISSQYGINIQKGGLEGIKSLFLD